MISKNPRFRPNSVKIFRVPPLRIFYPWTGPRTVGPRGPVVRGPVVRGKLGPGQLGLEPGGELCHKRMEFVFVPEMVNNLVVGGGGYVSSVAFLITSLDEANHISGSSRNKFKRSDSKWLRARLDFPSSEFLITPVTVAVAGAKSSILIICPGPRGLILTYSAIPSISVQCHATSVLIKCPVPWNSRFNFW